MKPKEKRELIATIGTAAALVIGSIAALITAIKQKVGIGTNATSSDSPPRLPSNT